METKHWHIEVKKIVYWTQRVFSKFHETYLTTTVHETFEGKEINLVDDGVIEIASYNEEYKRLCETLESIE